MKRTKQYRRPDFLFLSDLHLREDTPECRTDEFPFALEPKLQFVKRLQVEHNCKVLIPGDIFHHWKPSPFLISWAIENLPNDIIAIPGQHDLPQHNLEMIHKSGIYVLEKAGKLYILPYNDYVEIYENGHTIQIYGFPFGTILVGVPKEDGIIKVAMLHTLTWAQKIPYPDCKLDSAGQLLRRLKNWDLILVGDNHKQFTTKIGNRTLISPGSLSRQAADQIDFQPCCYAYYADTNEIEAIKLPIVEGVVSREHLERKEQRDGRIDAFVKRLDTDWEGGVSFEENLERMLAENEIKESVKSIIYKALEN